MSNVLFSVPFYHFKVNKWQEKKIELFNLYELILEECECDSDTNIITNFHKQTNKTVEGIHEILYEEIEKFCMETKCKTCNLLNAWFESAREKAYHGVHNHGPVGYSSVCYIKYNENKHTPTKFISPFNNFINGQTLKHTPKNISEGSIIFFPSAISHFTDPNFSEEERLIVSFNLQIE